MSNASLVILPDSGVALPSVAFNNTATKIAMFVSLVRRRTVTFDENIFEPEHIAIHSVVTATPEIVFQIPGDNPKADPDQYIEGNVSPVEIVLGTANLANVEMGDKLRRKMFSSVARMANIQETIDATLAPPSATPGDSPASNISFEDDEDEDEIEDFEGDDGDDDEDGDTDAPETPDLGSDPMAVIDVMRGEITEIQTKIAEYFGKPTYIADTSEEEAEESDDEDDGEAESMPLDNAIQTLRNLGVDEATLSDFRAAASKAFADFMSGLQVVSL